MHIRRFNASARRLCMPEVPEADFLAALRAIVREDAAWVPTEPWDPSRDAEQGVTGTG